MIESFTVRVAPEDETRVINFWANFGWRVGHTREVDRVDTDVSVGTDARYDAATATVNVTTTTYETKNVTRYVAILFQRDTTMQNYDELVRLENKYQANLDEDMPRGRVRAFVWAGIIFTAGIPGFFAPYAWAGIVFTAVALLLLIVGIRGRVKVNKQRREAMLRNEKRRKVRDSCVARARSLQR